MSDSVKRGGGRASRALASAWSAALLSSISVRRGVTARRVAGSPLTALAPKVGATDLWLLILSMFNAASAVR
jgi:hypothetical protein